MIHVAGSELDSWNQSKNEEHWQRMFHRAVIGGKMRYRCLSR
ncbi:hypothetical protein CCP3SC1AL1_3360002 [Gammaproteobacteria bacterium]